MCFPFITIPQEPQRAILHEYLNESDGYILLCISRSVESTTSPRQYIHFVFIIMVFPDHFRVKAEYTEVHFVHPAHQYALLMGSNFVTLTGS